MSYRKTDIESVKQNLRDAGCSEEFISAFLHAWEEDSPAEQQRLLSLQRCHLLDCVHAEQKKLDCLDYLRYQLRTR